MREILLVLAIFIMLIGPVVSEDPIILNVSKGIFFDYTDSTNGMGSFASYDELASQGQDQLKKTDHGSGTLEKKTFIGSNRTIYVDQDSYLILASSAISAKSSMDYAPRSMTLGTGYYVSHPLHFNLHLDDKIQIKNYASETSMVHEIRYATAVNKYLKAETTTADLYDGNYYDLGRSFMGLSGKVTEGTTHIEMLHSDTHDRHPGKSAWSIAKSYLDEVYSGTFSLNTSMSVNWPVIRKVGDDGWLPCDSCGGGWDEMNIHDQRYHGAEGFFDFSTCRFPYCKPKMHKDC